MRVNIGQWVTRHAALNGDKAALVCDGVSTTYRQLDERSDRLANGLLAGGLTPGDRVALLLLNGSPLVEAVVACAKSGLVAVPLNWRLSAHELTEIVDDCRPSALIYDGDLAAVGARLTQHRSWTVGPMVVSATHADSSYEAFMAASEATAAVNPAVSGDAPHVILYTSGTTGRAKGVILTHANTFWQSINGWALGAAPDTRALVILPLFHAGGLNGSVTPLLHIGATAYIPRRFEVGAVLKSLASDQINGMVAVPTIYQLLADHPEFATTDLSSVDAFISGGAPLARGLVERYEERGIELRQGYGLTETAPGATGMGPGDHLRKAGTVGKPCLYTEVRIVDDSGMPLSAGDVGEICIKGPNVTPGYWERPDATQRALRGGWFHSGDLGYLDADGFLTVVGRMKDMIISGGENIYPAEVENHLVTHPAVAEAAVVGIPDPRWGEVPVAFVVLHPQHQTTCEELRAYCAARIAKYKVPRAVHLRGELPRNALGKVVKPALSRDLS